MSSTKMQTLLVFLCIEIVCLVVLLWKLTPLTDLQQKLWQKSIDQEWAIKSGATILSAKQLTDSREPLVTPKEKAKFLYMLQTESCLSEYLQKVIGDPSVCPCDVSVLSFKTKCNKPPPPNVKYIYTGTNTSWGGGRNVLYEEAMKRKQEYLYFIILDDDIILTEVPGNMSNGTPCTWRKFEEFLVRVEPAAAAVDIENNQWLKRAAKGRKNMKCYVDIDKSSEYFSVARYDAAFNAFHNKTIRTILPYTSKFDQTSWNFSPIYINIKIEIMYAGQSLLHNKIYATNTQHRPYPKHWASSQKLGSIIDEVAKDIPDKYRDSILMKGWRKDGLKHEQWSPTLCIPPPPPKVPIMPFGYLDGELAVYISELEVQPLYGFKYDFGH